MRRVNRAAISRDRPDVLGVLGRLPLANKITVTPEDLHTVVRDQQEEILNLRLVVASVRRQLVEAQVALAAKGNETTEAQKKEKE